MVNLRSVMVTECDYKCEGGADKPKSRPPRWVRNISKLNKGCTTSSMTLKYSSGKETG
jgi:hypothetical protein